MNSVPFMRVLLIAFTPKDLNPLRDHLRGTGVQVTAATPNLKQLLDAGWMGSAFTHILVNFDAFDDLETGCNAILAFRKRFDHVVILCSAHVDADDLGSEHATICDNILRLPVSLEKLQQELRVASDNSHNRLSDRDV